MSELQTESVMGGAIEPYLPALAALRCEVFREFPYLYEGTPDYETRYLRTYASSPRSLVVIARLDEQVVGAATAMPLLEHTERLAPTFERAGIAPSRVFYFGESVLRAPYRRRGIGHAFFDAREQCAAELGFTLTAFCAVERAEDDPRRPAQYVPHDAFWRKRGYTKQLSLRTEFSWLDLGDAAETAKPMVFWTKELG